MAELRFYGTNAELPEAFSYQVHDFIRLVFGVDLYLNDTLHDVNAPYAESFWNPVHFVMAERNALFSYTNVMWKMLEHSGELYKCYGISNMLTYPAYRGRGYGTRVMEAATAHIRRDPLADIAILWTAPSSISFYTRAGWELMPTLTVLSGDPIKPDVFDDEPALMLFLSERAQRNRSTFENQPLYFGDYTW